MEFILNSYPNHVCRTVSHHKLDRICERKQTADVAVKDFVMTYDVINSFICCQMPFNSIWRFQWTKQHSRRAQSISENSVGWSLCFFVALKAHSWLLLHILWTMASRWSSPPHVITILAESDFHCFTTWNAFISFLWFSWLLFAGVFVPPLCFQKICNKIWDNSITLAIHFAWTISHWRLNMNKMNMLIRILIWIGSELETQPTLSQCARARCRPTNAAKFIFTLKLNWMENQKSNISIENHLHVEVSPGDHWQPTTSVQF